MAIRPPVAVTLIALKKVEIHCIAEPLNPRLNETVRRCAMWAETTATFSGAPRARSLRKPNRDAVTSQGAAARAWGIRAATRRPLQT